MLNFDWYAPPQVEESELVGPPSFEVASVVGASSQPSCPDSLPSVCLPLQLTSQSAISDGQCSFDDQTFPSISSCAVEPSGILKKFDAVPSQSVISDGHLSIVDQTVASI